MVSETYMVWCGIGTMVTFSEHFICPIGNKSNKQDQKGLIIIFILY